MSMLHQIKMCITLVSVSKPFGGGPDGGHLIELKFELPMCGEFQSGYFCPIIRASDAGLWMVGDTYFFRMGRP